MMRNRHRSIVAVTVLLACLTATAAQAAHSWDIKGKVGVGIPLADLSDTHDLGFAAGLGLTRWFSPHWGIQFGGAGEFLAGKAGFPDVELWHYNIGPEFDLLNPESGPWRLHANVGVGGTTMQFDGGDDTDVTLNIGLNLEYAFKPYMRFIVGPDFYAIFDEETEYVLPIQAGFRYLFLE